MKFRRALYGMLLLSLLAAALLCVGWLSLRSAWGEAFLAEQVQTRLNAAGSGQWTVGRVGFRRHSLWFSGVELRNDERPVLRIPAGEIRLSLRPLLKKELRLRVEMNALWISTAENFPTFGHPSARPQKPSFSAWTLNVTDIALHHVTVELPRKDRASQLGPLEVRGFAKRASGKTTASVSVSSGEGSDLVATLQKEEDWIVHLSRLELSTDLARQILPGWPLQKSLFAQGLVQWGNVDGHIDLSIHTGTAGAKLTGSLTALKAQLNLDAKRVGFKELFGVGDERLRDVKGELSGDVKALAAQLRLDVPQLLSIDAVLAHRMLTVKHLSLTPPGAVARFSGSIDAHALHLSGPLAARNLRALSSFIRPFVPNFPTLAGEWNGTLQLNGPLRALALKADGVLSEVELGPLRGKKVHATLEMPNLSDPLQLHAKVEGANLALAPFQARHMEVGVDTSQHDFRVLIRSTGAFGFSLWAQGERRRSAFSLKDLHIDTLRSRFRLQGPAQIRLFPQFSITPLVLRSGEEWIRLSVKKTRRSFDAVAQLTSVRFSSPALEGTFDADLTANGSGPAPEVSGWIAVRKGRIQSLKAVSLRMEGRFSSQHTLGQLQARIGNAQAQANWDIPLQDVPQAGRGWAYLRGLSAAQMRDLGWKSPQSGSIDADLRLFGTGEKPELTLQLFARSLVFRKAPPVNGTVALKFKEGDPFFAQLNMALLGRSSSISFRAPFSLAQLRRHLPEKEDLLKASYELKATLNSFPLPILYTSGFLAELLTGTVSADVDLKGSLRGPQGRAKISFAGVGRVRTPILRGQLLADFQPNQTGVNLSVVRQETGYSLLEFQGQLGRGIESSLADLEAAPLRAKFDLRALELSELRALISHRPVLLAPNANRRTQTEHPPVTGRLDVSASILGTLGNPQIGLHGSLNGLGMPAGTLGNLALQYNYQGARHQFQGTAVTQNKGTLNVRGQAQMDIGLGAIRKGLPISKMPVSGNLWSRQLDLGFASGLLPVFRRTGGLMTADLAFGGVPERPKLSGQIFVTRGELSLAGLGSYRDLELLLRGDQQRFTLERLSARSGNGDISITLAAEERNRRFFLKGGVRVSRFPAFSDDQLRATVTGEAHAEGELRSRIFDFTRFVVTRADVTLPAVPPRTLQPLDEPNDVIYSRSGIPVPPEQQPQSLRTPAPTYRQPLFRMYIRAFTPQPIYVHGKDLDAEALLSQGYLLKLELPTQMYGDISVTRGRLDVYGRRFQLARGSRLIFNGENTNPTVDGSAVYANEREQLKISIKVGGRLNSLSLQPTSDPPLSEQEIYSVLTTGRRAGAGENTINSNPSGSNNVGTTEETASFIGALFATQLTRQVAPQIPLDVLTVESSSTGSTAGTKLEAGRYIGRKFYVGYEARLGVSPLRRENRNAVRVEYQLGRHWAFEGSFGDSLIGGADLLWSREY